MHDKFYNHLLGCEVFPLLKSQYSSSSSNSSKKAVGTATVASNGNPKDATIQTRYGPTLTEVVWSKQGAT